jgi:hypothetical protein
MAKDRAFNFGKKIICTINCKDTIAGILYTLEMFFISGL